MMISGKWGMLKRKAGMAMNDPIKRDEALQAGPS